jgi:hypothetical protein
MTPINCSHKIGECGSTPTRCSSHACVTTVETKQKMAEMKISGQDIFNSKILVSCGLAHIGENNLVSAFDSHLL